MDNEEIFDLNLEDSFESSNDVPDVEDFADLDLEVVDNSDFAASVSDQLEYPCIVLHGVTTVEELHFFSERYHTEESALPLFIEVEGQIKKIGFFELTLDSLLSIKCIAHYDIYLHRKSDDVVHLDLNDPALLIKFSKISR